MSAATHEQITRAAEAWSRILGPEHVRLDESARREYTRNTGEVRRAIAGVVRPSTTEEVRQVVRIANRFKTPLYPISTGKNWGLGSRLPVRDGAVVVDLGRMNRIREINARERYAVVEPGVTQQDLHERLKREPEPLIFNVTGSAAGTSLIGNALERGVGYFDSRGDSLSGLEVVLGNGEVIRTGFGQDARSRVTHVCRHGIGPSLDGLFAESNFGIVTAAGFDLIPDTDDHLVLISKIRRGEDLPRLVEVFAELRRRGVVRGVTHIGNRNRTEIVLAPLLARRLYPGARWDDPALRAAVKALLDRAGFGPWSAVAALMGTRAQLAAARREVTRRLAGLASTVFLNDRRVAAAKRLARALRFIPAVRRQEALLLAVEPLYRLARGVPTDAALYSAYWPVGETPAPDARNPDHSRSGMLFCVPILTPDPQTVTEAVALIERLYGAGGFDAYITLNLVDDRSIETVINLAFDRSDPERVRSAHACNRKLTEAFIERGFLPYRIGIESMDLVVDASNPFWKTVQRIKDALDPHHIIAPGRYAPNGEE